MRHQQEKRPSHKPPHSQRKDAPELRWNWFQNRYRPSKPVFEIEKRQSQNLAGPYCTLRCPCLNTLPYALLFFKACAWSVSLFSINLCFNNYVFRFFCLSFSFDFSFSLFVLLASLFPCFFVWTSFVLSSFVYTVAVSFIVYWSFFLSLLYLFFFLSLLLSLLCRLKKNKFYSIHKDKVKPYYKSVKLSCFGVKIEVNKQRSTNNRILSRLS